MSKNIQKSRDQFTVNDQFSRNLFGGCSFRSFTRFASPNERKKNKKFLISIQYKLVMRKSL